MAAYTKFRIPYKFEDEEQDRRRQNWLEIERYVQKLPTSSGGSTSPGGSDTAIQFNDSGAFGGSSYLTFDDSTQTFTTEKSSTSSTTTIVGGDIIKLVAPNSNSFTPFPSDTSMITSDGGLLFYANYLGSYVPSLSMTAAGDFAVGGRSVALSAFDSSLDWLGGISSNGTGITAVFQGDNVGGVPAQVILSSSGSATGSVQISCTHLGFHGVTPVPMASPPTTLADVITLLQDVGLCL